MTLKNIEVLIPNPSKKVYIEDEGEIKRGEIGRIQIEALDFDDEYEDTNFAAFYGDDGCLYDEVLLNEMFSDKKLTKPYNTKKIFIRVIEDNTLVMFKIENSMDQKVVAHGFVDLNRSSLEIDTEGLITLTYCIDTQLGQSYMVPVEDIIFA